MPRANRTRRLTRPVAGSVSTLAPEAGAAAVRLVSALAGAARVTDVLPHLHQHAIEVTGGNCSLLLEYNPRNGALQATSGYGLEELQTDPWNPAEAEAALVSQAFAARRPAWVADAVRGAPDLAGRLARPSLLVLPLAAADRRVGLLVVGFDPVPEAPWLDADVRTLADTFVTVLELFHLRQRKRLQEDVLALIYRFSESLSTTLSLTAGLDVFCHGATVLFGADRASVWIHDRRARDLVLRGSTDPDQVARTVRLSTQDNLAPAALALRHTRAELLTPAEEATAIVTVPLRGCRRALGTAVFEGVRVEAGGELDLLDRADELGRQLSAAVETMQLLEELMRSRRELENAFNSIADLVAVSDPDGRLVHVNEAFARRLGSSPDELRDRPIADCVGPELLAWMRARDADADDTARSPLTRQLVDPVLNGPFLVTVTDLRSQDRERVGSVLVARDLTPHSKLEAEREELRRRLTQSEKLAALGQFVAGIAHELNNPLQGVLGHLELMKVTGVIPKPLRREVQTVYREADRAAKIVRNLLVFAGSRRLTRRSVSVTALLHKVLALRAAAFRACDIEVVRHYDQKPARVHADPLLLHQAFLNIVMNAEQAIAAAGRPGRIEITTGQAGDHVVVTVRDTGDGIPQDVLSRIFEPFYTTKDVGKGTGLGLAIAYGIVQEHGGQIVASTHPEGGAVFRVELPAMGRPPGSTHD
jgi:PAS domain S-box-containing protein